MNEHSPGPWTATLLERESLLLITDANGMPIAIVVDDRIGDRYLANGRLMAESPETRRKLKQFLAAAEAVLACATDASATREKWLSLNQLRAAVAEAKGESDD